MKNDYLIISYYTDNYTDIAKKYLLKSLSSISVPNYILKIPSKLDWKKNTQYKPYFILNCFRKFDKDLIFIDIDATINQYPSLFDNLPSQYDIAVHYLDWEVHYGKNKTKKELLSGTMYLRNNKEVYFLIKKWIANLKYVRWEQEALEKALNNSPNIKVFNLPREYCYIISTPDGEPFIKLDNPIITHYQAGRKKR